MLLKNIKRTFFTFLCLFSLLSARALNAIETYQNQKQGSIKKGDTLNIQDGKFLNSKFDWQKIHNKEVTNVITFALYRESEAIPQKAFKCQLNLKVEYWSSPDAVDPQKDDNIKLEISFDPAKGASYQSFATYRFKSAHKIKLTVNDITSAELGSDLPAAFSLKGQIIVERSYEFDPTPIVPTLLFNKLTNAASLSWTTSQGAEEYDLEWTFIDELSENGRLLENANGNIDNLTLARLFRNNATRVTLQQEYYDISLVHYMKYLLIRIRPVIYDKDNFRNDSAWSYKLSQNEVTGPSVVTIDGKGHEPRLNWQYSVVYVEDGKKKEMISYFDGSLRNRQTVTVNNSDQKAIIQESIYDEYGRPLASILPFAAKDTTLNYHPGQHLADSGRAYTYKNVYGDTGVCVNTPHPLSDSAGAGRYYSPKNYFLSDTNHREMNYVPDAEGYPLSVNLYTNDNTNRIRVKGGVGPIFQPGKDTTVSKATRYYYGKPLQWELDQMFGNDVGYENHYFKNVSIDPNNQASITYLNASGQTIATAFTGAAPSNLDALPNIPKPHETTRDILLPHNFNYDETNMTLSATHTYIATIIGKVTFRYNVSQLIKTYDSNAVKICSNCYYNLRVRIADECNTILVDSTVNVGSLVAQCNKTNPVIDSLTTYFDKIGSYDITFDLSIPPSAINNYTDDFVTRNKNLSTQWSFVEAALKTRNMNACFDDCNTCLESLGTKAAFTAAVKEQLIKDGVTGNADHWADSLYNALLQNCQSIRNSCATDPCADLEITLKADISPGGQYALFAFDGRPTENNVNVIWQNWGKVFPVIDPKNASPEQLEVYNSNIILLEDGSEISLNSNEFFYNLIPKNWRPEWADLLVKYHPEYCALEFCHANRANQQFDEKLNRIDAIADIPAMIPGATYSKVDPGWLVNADPAFSGTLAAYKPAMSEALKYYTTDFLKIASLPNKSLPEYVDYLLYCADTTATTNTVNLANTWTNCTPSEACRIKDLEWRSFREKYVELKQYYYDELRATDAYCGGKCPVGTTSFTYDTSSCPDVSLFTIEKGNVACNRPGTLPYKLVYNGSRLLKEVTVTLYYPDKYSRIEKVESLLMSGLNYKDFCIDTAIDVTSIVVKEVSCKPMPHDFTCTDATNLKNFPPPIVTPVGPDMHPQYFTIRENYNGPDIPVGASVTLATEFRYLQMQNGEVVDTFYINPTPAFKFDHDTRSVTIRVNLLTEPWLVSRSATCSYTPSCDTLLKYKTSRISRISYAAPAITTDTAALRVIAEQGFQEALNDNCLAQANKWMAQLEDCLQSQPGITPAIRQILRNKLIEVCKLGGDETHPAGASTAAANSATSEGYRSFKDVLMKVLKLNNFSMTCNPWLMDAPYPHSVQMQATEKTIGRTDPAICHKLAAMESEYNNSNSGLSFYNYLVSRYSDAMNLTATEFESLRSGCGNCRFLLPGNITMPVFLDPGTKGCITAAEFKAGISAMENEVGTWLKEDSSNYEFVYTTYLNHYWGFTLSYSEFKDYRDSVDKHTDYKPLLCNKPVFRTAKEDPYNCARYLVDDAVAAGNHLYDQYITAVKTKFRKEYIAYCKNVGPTLKIKAAEQLYHFTLYYYDQAGNLVRTVPPEGVHLLDSSLWEAVDSARNHNNIACNYNGPTTNTPFDTIKLKLGYAFRLDRTSIETWLNTSAKGGQLLVHSGDNGYFFNMSLAAGYLTMDVYKTDTIGKVVNITQSWHTMVYTGPITQAFTHVVVQGNGLAQDNLDVYVNGKKCEAVDANTPVTAGYGWELETRTNYPLNLSFVKHLRAYSRQLDESEILANANQECFWLADEYYSQLYRTLLLAARENVPQDNPETINGEMRYALVYPNHGLLTTYAYQSMNGVIKQRSPDAGETMTFYDRLGRVAITQNAKQADKIPLTYSYLKYDDQGRVVEAGETYPLSATLGYFMDSTALNMLYNSPSGQIINTYYDNYSKSGLTQDNLRKRVAATTYRELNTDSVQQATYYSYDQMGNVKSLWQQIGGLGIKKIEYQYNLVSGKVNTIRYQNDTTNKDRFWYGYEYDAENRLILATTGINTVSKDGWKIENPRTDAFYRYYLHGSLARTELGHESLVQGIDYAYTLQGWTKAVNGQYLSPAGDIGYDGKPATNRSTIAPDIYGYSLDYYKGDYKSIGQNKALSLTWNNGATTEAGRNLYNGNISRSTMAISQFDNVSGYSYRYDQLNRLKQMRHHSLNSGTTTWSTGTADDQYREDITYDGNGNILTYLRNGSRPTNNYAMDKLGYVYQKDASGNLIRNRLLQVKDDVTNSPYSEDLKGQGINNYQYDNIGNMISDAQAGISKIEWTVYGKISKIIKATDSLKYQYDVAGNRVYKAYFHDGKVDKTWYVRDGDGHVLAVYGNKNGDNEIYWKEQGLYGNARMGSWHPDFIVSNGDAAAAWGIAGRKRYELTNHLNNVIATIGEYRTLDNKATIYSAQDYYPFGMIQPDRNYASGAYRYGFNGKENDNEVKGTGNQQDYGMRIYDPRIGKFLSIDPLTQVYPFLTPYQFAANTPIQATDLDGAETDFQQVTINARRDAEIKIDNAQKIGVRQIVKTYGAITTRNNNWAEKWDNFNHSQPWFSLSNFSSSFVYTIANDATITYTTLVYGKSNARGMDGSAVSNYKERVGSGLNTLQNIFLPLVELKINFPKPPSMVQLRQDVIVKKTAIRQANKQVPRGVVGVKLPNGAENIMSSGGTQAEIADQLIGPSNALGGVGTKTSAGTVVGCCAEFRAANPLLIKYPQYSISDLWFTDVIDIRSINNKVIPACDNCAAMFPRIPSVGPLLIPIVIGGNEVKSVADEHKYSSN